MALTLNLETLFLEVLNTSWIYLITSKVRFIKGLVNSIMTYIPNMTHICPHTSGNINLLNYKTLGCSITILVPFIIFIYFAWLSKILWTQVYIVYMGDLPKGKISASSIHTNILQEVVGRLLVKKILILNDNRYCFLYNN